MKKKIMIILGLIILTIGLGGCGGSSQESINVYNWGDFIDRDVIREFEKEYGIRVNYSMYETNEDMYIRLKQGGNSYDVVFPSEYMIERMINEDMLLPLNKENIPNLENVKERFLDLDYDRGNTYSVPYMWGTLGIIYNSQMVDGEVDSWDILWDEKYANEIIMLNSQRDTLAVALKRLGYSLNTRNIEELEEARDLLVEQKPLVYAYLGDEVKDIMIGGEAALAVVWSGDAMYMMWENPDLNYIIPKEGSNLFLDAMVIPASAENKEGAEKFINFMARPDIALKNTEYIGYSTPIEPAIAMLDDEIKNSSVAYPTDEEIENTEMFKDLADILVEYDRIWTEIMSE